jgi:hypothetical protein
MSGKIKKITVLATLAGKESSVTFVFVYLVVYMEIVPKL